MNNKFIYKLLQKLEDNEKYISYLERFIEDLSGELEKLKEKCNIKE